MVNKTAVAVEEAVSAPRLHDNEEKVYMPVSPPRRPPNPYRLAQWEKYKQAKRQIPNGLSTEDYEIELLRLSRKFGFR